MIKKCCSNDVAAFAELSHITLFIIWLSVFARLSPDQFAVRNLLYGSKVQRKCSFRSSKSLYLGKKV